MDSLRRRGPGAGRSRQRHVSQGRHRSCGAHLPELRRAGWAREQVTEWGAVHRDSRRQPPPSASANGKGALLALRDRANTVLPGLYAWLTTVASPSVNHGAPRSARLTALLALLALLA